MPWAFPKGHANRTARLPGARQTAAGNHLQQPPWGQARSQSQTAIIGVCFLVETKNSMEIPGLPGDFLLIYQGNPSICRKRIPMAVSPPPPPQPIDMEPDVRKVLVWSIVFHSKGPFPREVLWQNTEALLTWVPHFLCLDLQKVAGGNC